MFLHTLFTPIDYFVRPSSVRNVMSGSPELRPVKPYGSSFNAILNINHIIRGRNVTGHSFLTPTLSSTFKRREATSFDFFARML